MFGQENIQRKIESKNWDVVAVAYLIPLYYADLIVHDNKSRSVLQCTTIVKIAGHWCINHALTILPILKVGLLLLTMKLHSATRDSCFMYISEHAFILANISFPAALRSLWLNPSQSNWWLLLFEHLRRGWRWASCSHSLGLNYARFTPSLVRKPDSMCLKQMNI